MPAVMESGVLTSPQKEWAQWSQDELSNAGLGDARLDARVVQVLNDFMSAPEGSIPRSSGGWPGAKAAYRLFDNAKMDPQVIIERHKLNVLERARGESLVLAIGDTTMLDHTSHINTDGLGPLGDLDHYGLLFQPTLMVTPQRVPLGLIDLQTWVRSAEDFGKSNEKGASKRPIEEKESVKWLQSLEATERFQRDLQDEETRVIAVFDREGDVFEVLSEAAGPDTRSGLLVRVAWDRRVDVDHPQKHVWSFMEAQPLASTLTVTVPRQPGSKERQATLAIRFAEVTIRPPKGRPVPDRTPVRIFCVYAHEEDPPKHTEAVSWMLFTTEAVRSFDDACSVIHWYTCRWMVEIFFRILKSGCKAEERQLETLERLERCLTLDSIVAWRVLYLTTIGRELPDLPCSVVFEEHEWKGVWAFLEREVNVPEEPPPLQEVVRMIGRLGGHLGRKQDKEPGPMTIWRGLQRLPDIAGMWLILRES
ncbi:MAG TPA: IS4 family transposase [Acidobacteriota bacterium]|nr:IS4 family transposase [Acidobacteriota bacterium]